MEHVLEVVSPASALVEQVDDVVRQVLDVMEEVADVVRGVNEIVFGRARLSFGSGRLRTAPRRRGASARDSFVALWCEVETVSRSKRAATGSWQPGPLTPRTARFASSSLRARYGGFGLEWTGFGLFS
jgi:hypothetical protein